MNKKDISNPKEERSNIVARFFSKHIKKIQDEFIEQTHSRLITFVLTSSVFGILGMIIFLSIDLPYSYRATNWDLAWVGFDCGLLAVIVVTLWALFHHKQLAIITSSVAGTILIIDSWFDVATSQGGRDFYVSLCTALFLELPFAFVLFSFSHRLLKQINNKEDK